MFPVIKIKLSNQDDFPRHKLKGRVVLLLSGASMATKAVSRIQRMVCYWVGYCAIQKSWMIAGKVFEPRRKNCPVESFGGNELVLNLGLYCSLWLTWIHFWMHWMKNPIINVYWSSLLPKLISSLHCVCKQGTTKVELIFFDLSKLRIVRKQGLTFTGTHSNFAMCLGLCQQQRIQVFLTCLQESSLPISPSPQNKCKRKRKSVQKHLVLFNTVYSLVEL